MHTVLFSIATMLQTNQPSPDDVMRILGPFLVLVPIFVLLGLALVIVPLWMICKKAGYSPWLALLCAVPLGQMILLYILAFGEWKVVPVLGVGLPQQPPYPPYPPYPPQR